MKDITEIVLLFDRSGSMRSVISDALGGFNTFLKEQQEKPGEANLSVYRFDDRYEPVYVGKSIREAKPLTEEDIKPRGWTRLLDAIGKCITETGERLSSIPEENRPNKIVICIQTDGCENDSKEYTLAQVNEMMEHQRTKYNWEINFIGSTIQARSAYSSYSGLAPRNKSPHKMSDSYKETFRGLSAGVSAVRGSASMQDYRAEQKDANFFEPKANG